MIWTNQTQPHRGKISTHLLYLESTAQLIKKIIITVDKYIRPRLMFIGF